MTSNARLKRSLQIATNYYDDRSGKEDKFHSAKGYMDCYQVPAEEAFQKIRPKNIKPETEARWRRVLGLK